MNRKNWTLEELMIIHQLPLMHLISRANEIHFLYHKRDEIQVNKLISAKTGGCPEDCRYCAQSSSYQTGLIPQKMMSISAVVAEAKRAIQNGVTRICLGMAWREVKEGKAFEELIEIIKSVKALGVEVCGTLGMVKEHQAIRLKEAGLYAFNHNLDTSENFYPSIITTRTYSDRLNTLACIAKAGLSVCSGGIIGMGESVQDRMEMLLQLTRLARLPDSVPINRLEPIKGTPFENVERINIWDIVRMIATTRIALPESMVRFAAGRLGLSIEQQALCFFAGVNSIFITEKLLTVGNPALDEDEEMFRILGLQKRKL